MVVNDVDISVNQKEVVGLLGPNGAGKTTTFYMITGMVKPTKGNIYFPKINDVRSDVSISAGGGMERQINEVPCASSWRQAS